MVCMSPVTITFLATICFLASVFYVCVLVQWIADTNRKIIHPAVDNQLGETSETNSYTASATLNTSTAK
jgi:hypothetical protein